MIRRLLSFIMAFFSALFGVLMILPWINRTVWTIQLVINEMPSVPLLLGLSSARRPKSLVEQGMAWLGALLALLPYTRWLRARRAMEAALVEALGAGYEAQIPIPVRARMQPGRYWVTNLLHWLSLPDVHVQHDIIYATPPQRPLKLDVYRPAQPSFDGRPFPAIIVVHGGGWHHGDKREYFSTQHRLLAAQGYVVFDIQYRLTDRDGIQWPVPLEDVRAAIRHVKAHAGEYDINPERIALLGRSAGAQIALSAAYRAQGEFADTAVRAVISVYGPVNLFLSGPEHDPRVVKYLGGTSYELPERYQDASPLTHVHAGAPSTLVLHGYQDWVVSPIHSEILKKRMNEQGRICALLPVPWARHAFDVVWPGLGAQLSQHYVDRFLGWALYVEQ